MTDDRPRVPSLRQSLGLFLSVALAVGILGWPFAHFDPYAHHEGSVLYPSLAALHGLTPMRDVNVEHLPTTSLLYSTAFAVFGERLLVARLLTLTATAALAGLLALWLGRFARPQVAGVWTLAYAVATWLVWDLVTRPWSTLWASLALWAAGLAVLQSLRDERPRWRVLGGALTGLVFLFRMNVGAYALLTLTASQVWLLRPQLAWQPLLRRLAPYLLATAAVAGAGSAALVLTFGLDAILHLLAAQRSHLATMQRLTGAHTLISDLGVNLVGLKAAAAYAVGIGIAWPRACKATPPLERVGWIALALAGAWATGLRNVDLGPGILAVGVWQLWRDRAWGNANDARAVLLAVAVAAWGIMAPGHDPRYAAWAAAPVHVLAVVAVLAPVQARHWQRATAAVLLFLLLGMPNPGRLWSVLRAPRVPLPAGTLYAGMAGDPAIAPEYRDLAALRDWVNAHVPVDAPILILHGELLHYAFLQRPPAVRPFNSLDNFAYSLPIGPSLDRDDVAQLTARPPAVVIASRHVWEVPDAWYTNTFPLTSAWLDQHMRRVADTPNGEFLLYVPLDAPK